MYPSLSTGAIGVKASFQEGLELAAKHGFRGYHFDITEAHKLGVEKARDLANANNLRLAAWGLPIEFRQDDVRYKNDLLALPAFAKTATELGVFRTATWILPCSDTLTYRHNFDLHVKRLKPVAEILLHHGIRFGLEYVGPKTFWSSKRYTFMHTMTEMLELCDALGPNVGLLVDSFHWFTAKETVDDLKQLSALQIVDAHINNAPKLPADEQQDLTRTLPDETKTINLNAYLQTLKAIGYDGPVMVEPFSKTLSKMSANDACATTAKSLKKVWQQAGLIW
jgi:sugar phosphate isomerase/epimerase